MSLRKQAVSGIKWTTVSTITLTVVNLLKISVLARFLDKTDFGLMALVTFVLGFMSLFMDMGLTSAILHRQEITKSEYASLYWVNVVFSIALVAIIIILSPLIAGFYNEAELNILIPLMSLSIILSALGKQFRTIEQKELNFKYLGIIDIISAMVGLTVGVVMAVMGYGVYALVLGSLATYGVSNIIFFIKGVTKYGILLHFNYKETKPFLGIGIYQVGGQIINYFNRDLDILIIGKFFGTEILGGYSLAKQLVRRPLQIIDPIINKVGVSILPRFQDDLKSLRRYLTKLLNTKAIVNAFVYGSITIFASYLVHIFYGYDYMSIVPYVQLFTILVYLRSMGNVVGIVVVTTGKTNYEFYWNIFTTLFTPIAIYVGSMYSVYMIIILMILAQFLLLLPSWFVFYKKLLKLNFTPYITSHITPLTISTFFVFIALIVFENILAIEIISTLLMGLTLLWYGYKNIGEIKELTKYIKEKAQRLK